MTYRDHKQEVGNSGLFQQRYDHRNQIKGMVASTPAPRQQGGPSPGRAQTSPQFSPLGEYIINNSNDFSILVGLLQKTLGMMGERLSEGIRSAGGKPLTQSVLDAMDFFDGMNKAKTTSWLEQVELIAGRMGISPTELATTKLKGDPCE